jgi:diguanylate cyclase (GGDEF)-like protein
VSRTVHPALVEHDTRISTRVSRVEPLLLLALAADGLLGQKLPLWADAGTVLLAATAAVQMARPRSSWAAARGLVATVLAIVELTQGYPMTHWLLVLAAAYPLLAGGWGGLSVAILASFGAAAVLPSTGVSLAASATIAMLCVAVGVAMRRLRQKYTDDLANIRRVTRAARDRERYASALLESQPNPTAVISSDGVIRADNLAWRALLDDHGLSAGITRAGTPGRGDQIAVGWVIDTLVPTERGGYLAAAIDAVLAGEVEEHRSEIDITDRRQALRNYSVLVRPLVGGGVILRLTDITALRINDTLLHAANHDALTGLTNRSGFTDQLERAMRRPHEGALAVLFVDLDRFKEVNDRHGHRAGDELLVAVTERMRKAVRPGDVLARLGGDEFVVLCPDVPSMRVAEHIADRIVQVLCQPFSIMGRTVSIGASVGIASSSTATDATALLAQADAAMYAVKRSGRRGHSTFAARPDQVIDLTSTAPTR